MSPPVDEGIGFADVVQVAKLVVTSHERGQACQKCTDAGCDQLDWARDIVEQVRTDAAALRRKVATW